MPEEMFDGDGESTESAEEYTVLKRRGECLSLCFRHRLPRGGELQRVRFESLVET
jgi:hypothetical protein